MLFRSAIDHVAINCDDIKGCIKTLKKDKVPFEVRKVPKRPLQQVFVHDPDGVMIELNFWNEADVPELKPQSADGRRTSIPGKAMDRAEDLKKDVDAYNRTIEDTIAQGTADAPPTSPKPTPKRSGGSSPAYRPSEPGAVPPPTP